MNAQFRQPLILVEWLRFACALGVVALHYGVTFWHAPSLRAYALLHGVAYRSPFEAVFTQGWIGVELFFVISGMMIAHSSVGISRAIFLRRRLERLGPAVWVCATISLLIVASQLGIDGELARGWLRSVMFVPVLAQIDDSYWTLGVELSFYLLVATVIGHRGRPGLLHGLAMLIGAASGLFWLSAAIGADPAALAGNRLVQLTLLPHGCFFALGILLAHAIDRRPTPIVMSALAITMATAFFEITAHARLSTRLTGIDTPLALPVGIFFLGLAALAIAPRLQPWLARHCDPALARRWGCTTFPLYLLHQDAGAAIVGPLARGGMPVGMALAITTGVMVFASLAISGRIEPAIRAWLRHQFDRYRTPTPITTPISP